MPNADHLKMIQEVIGRLAGNSGQMKRWTLAIVAALLGLAATDDRLLAVVAVYIVLVLAFLDAYYLAQERAYRALYDAAVAGEVADWTMQAARVRASDVVRAASSPSVGLLYGLSVAAALGILLSA